MPLVKMPTGEMVNMPDHPTEEQLAQLSSLMKAPPGGSSTAPTTSSASTGSPAGATSRPIGEEFMRQLGLTARAGIQGMSGTVGAVGDALNAGVNAVAGTHLAPVSSTINQLVDKYLPQPENDTERAVQAVTRMGFGFADPVMGEITQGIQGVKALGGGAQALYDAPAQLTAQQQALQNAQKAGYVVPPKEAGSSPLGNILQTFAGSNQVNKIAEARNQELTNKLAAKAAGLPEGTPLSADNLQKLIADTSENAYGPARALTKMPTDNIYGGTLADIALNQGGAKSSIPANTRQDILDLVNAHNVRNFTGKDAVDAIQNLRGKASQAYKEGDVKFGEAANGIAKAIEDNIAMHMTSGAGPATEGATTGQELIDAMRAGREQLAKQYAVQRAMQPSGEVSAPAFATALKNKAPLTDELKLIGQFAAHAPKASGVPKEDPAILGGADIVSGMLPALLGHHPLGLLAAATRPALRYGLLTGPGQSLFASQAAPAAAGQVPLMVQGMPAAYAGVQSLFGQ